MNSNAFGLTIIFILLYNNIIFNHPLGDSVLSIRQTQLSIFKRLQEHLTKTIEIEEILASTSCMVLCCTSYHHKPLVTADLVIKKIKAQNLKNKPTVVCYTHSALECLRATCITTNDDLVPGLLPMQIFILIKWSNNGGEDYQQFIPVPQQDSLEAPARTSKVDVKLDEAEFLSRV